MSAPTRRSGGVRKVREGVWRVDVEVRRDPITGHRRRISRQIRGTREDAEVALARLRVADHEKRLPTIGTSARSVRAALDLYVATIDSGRIEMAPRGLVTVRSAVNTMSSIALPDGREFGRIRLNKLTWMDIEQLYATMRASGRSSAWTRRCATVVTQAFELARKRGLLESNPARDATRPRTSRSKPYAPRNDELRALVEIVTARDPELGDATVVLASTGMRKGELLALRWADVDLDSAQVHVAAAVTDGGPRVGVVRKETKRSDWRDVPLTDSAVAALRRQHARRSSLLKDVLPSPEAFVFAGSVDGTVLHRPDTFSDRWAAARGSAPVTLQHLRHYSATAMLDAGESFRTVADILGNSENTLRLHYDGRVDTGKRRAIAALEL
jgi:integrase